MRRGGVLRVLRRIPALGELRFKASSGHATVTSYEARLYAVGGSTLLASLSLGKPTPDGSGYIVRNLRTWLDSQTSGNYDLKVAAIDGTGTSESSAVSLTVPVS